jgi:predicted RNA binding protein YcfA (HicA-like mRNA interferase family)
MVSEPSLLRLLRNTSVRDLERAIMRDGFALKRQSQTGGRVYTHEDGRTVGLHYHHANDRLKRGTLGNVLIALGWTIDDARRLGLIS